MFSVNQKRKIAEAVQIEYVVEIDEGCWLCDVEGDPGRTLVIENAQRFKSVEDAENEVEIARTYRLLRNVHIYPFNRLE